MGHDQVRMHGARFRVHGARFKVGGAGYSAKDIRFKEYGV